MAAVRVLISQGSRTILRDWEEDDPSRLHQDNWRLSSTLWPQKWIEDHSTPPERPRVFLCLDEESLAEGFDLEFLAKLTNQARPYMWGSEIYVLLHTETPLINPITQIPRPSTEEMFKHLLEKGVVDVLHWSFPNVGDAAGRSANRMKQISIPDPGWPWKCFVHQPPNLGPQQERFLDPFLIHSTNELGKENCLIVFQENRDPDRCMRYLEHVPRLNLPGAVMIGVIDRIGELPTDVKKLCKQLGYQLVQFHGLVELYYFLLRLDQASQIRPELLDFAFSIHVRQRIFEYHRPKLLITHSYSPDAEDDCVAAAHDTWELTKEVQGAAEVIIYPAVHVSGLADALDKLQDVFAWVHIGHGTVGGMKQSGDDLYKPAENWLGAFGGVGRSSLPLAIFASCNSAAMAERFAAAGAGVAIGFKEGLAQDQAAALTKRLVMAALNSAGSQDRILSEFWSRRRLITGTDENNRPVAYWSRS